MVRKRVTFRRRQVIVKLEFLRGAEFPTKFEVYPDHIRITQTKVLGKVKLVDIISLDPLAMEYLIQLWQEVKDG